jgi:hypothetical protein
LAVGGELQRSGQQNSDTAECERGIGQQRGAQPIADRGRGCGLWGGDIQGANPLVTCCTRIVFCRNPAAAARVKLLRFVRNFAQRTTGVVP